MITAEQMKTYLVSKKYHESADCVDDKKDYPGALYIYEDESEDNYIVIYQNKIELYNIFTHRDIAFTFDQFNFANGFLWVTEKFKNYVE